jgi:glycosyltransferase involved in cell wall biosynthesis
VRDARRVLYIQYTNPAGYPPLLHSSRILADSDWEVLILGTGAHGAGDFQLETHPRIREERLRYFPPGPFQKVQYFRFASRALVHLLRWKPQWCYASDLWSCPVAVWAQRLGCRVVYHEHDEPPLESSSRYVRACLHARRKVAARAALCVLPSEGRRARFQKEHPDARTVCVWNCPSVREVPEPHPEPNKDFVVYYHGSIVPQRLPLHVVGALRLLPADAQLRIVGYETIGARGYIDALLQYARTIGIEKRVTHQRVPGRAQLWPLMRTATVGLSLMPVETGEPNLDTMAGASNKPFEYLAAELALLFSDRPDWKDLFGEYGAACTPDSAESIAAALRTLYVDRKRTLARGAAGRLRVLEEWNYERQFEPVQQVMEQNG